MSLSARPSKQQTIMCRSHKQPLRLLQHLQLMLLPAMERRWENTRRSRYNGQVRDQWKCPRCGDTLHHCRDCRHKYSLCDFCKKGALKEECFAAHRQAAAACGSNCTERGWSVHNVAEDEATARYFNSDDYQRLHSYQI